MCFIGVYVIFAVLHNDGSSGLVLGQHPEHHIHRCGLVHMEVVIQFMVCMQCMSHDHNVFVLLQVCQAACSCTKQMGLCQLMYDTAWHSTTSFGCTLTSLAFVCLTNHTHLQCIHVHIQSVWTLSNIMYICIIMYNLRIQ
jgi:hypothetical protein